MALKILERQHGIVKKITGSGTKTTQVQTLFYWLCGLEKSLLGASIF